MIFVLIICCVVSIIYIFYLQQVLGLFALPICSSKRGQIYFYPNLSIATIGTVDWQFLFCG